MTDSMRSGVGRWAPHIALTATLAMPPSTYAEPVAECAQTESPCSAVEIVDVKSGEPGDVTVVLGSASTTETAVAVYDLNGNEVSSAPIVSSNREVILSGAAAGVSEHGLQYRAVVEDSEGNPLSNSYPYYLRPAAESASGSPAIPTTCAYEVFEGLQADVSLLMSAELDQLLDGLGYCRLEEALAELLETGPPELACEVEGLLAQLAQIVDPGAGLPQGACASTCSFLWQAVVGRAPEDRYEIMLDPQKDRGFEEYVEHLVDAAYCAAVLTAGDSGQTFQHLRTVDTSASVALELRRRSGATPCAPACEGEVSFQAVHTAELEVEAETFPQSEPEAAAAVARASALATFAIQGDVVFSSLVESAAGSPFTVPGHTVASSAVVKVSQPALGALVLSGEAETKATGDAWAFAMTQAAYELEACAEAVCLPHPLARLEAASSVDSWNQSGSKLARPPER